MYGFKFMRPLAGQHTDYWIRSVFQNLCTNGRARVATMYLHAFGADTDLFPPKHSETDLSAPQHSDATVFQKWSAVVSEWFSANDNATAFYSACERGHTRIVEMFLLNGSIPFDPNVGQSGGKALYYACKGGHEHIVEKLINGLAKFDPNYVDAEKRTALMQACIRGHYMVVKLLLESSGLGKFSSSLKVNHEDDDNRTAAILATYNDQPAVINVLLMFDGINWGHHDRTGHTAWSIASELAESSYGEQPVRRIFELDHDFSFDDPDPSAILALLGMYEGTKYARRAYIGIDGVDIPENECHICNANEPNVILQCCGKIQQCSTCAAKCSDCPFCKAKSQFSVFENDLHFGTPVTIRPDASIRNQNSNFKVRDDFSMFQDQQGVVLERLTEQQSKVRTSMNDDVTRCNLSMKLRTFQMGVDFKSSGAGLLKFPQYTII